MHYVTVLVRAPQRDRADRWRKGEEIIRSWLNKVMEAGSQIYSVSQHIEGQELMVWFSLKANRLETLGENRHLGVEKVSILRLRGSQVRMDSPYSGRVSLCSIWAFS